MILHLKFTNLPIFKFIFSIIIIILYYSCSIQPFNYNYENSKEFVYKIMKDEYLWYDRTPNLDYNSFETPEKLLDAMKVKEDRWSFIWTKQEYDNYFQQGKSYGYGYAYNVDYEKFEFVVLLVYPNSPAAKAGLKRSDRIIAINDTNISFIISNKLWNLVGPTTNIGVPRKLKIIDNKGYQKEITMYSSDYEIVSVITNLTIITNSRKIGYLFFNHFIEPSKNELDNSFQYFKNQNISDLIVDLRYNGGGLVSVANYLASLIGGNFVRNKVFVKIIHNNKKWFKNSTIYFENPINKITNIRSVYFITTRSTASASENVINGLKPFLNVYLIGEPTHGKPVGMYSFEYSNIVLLPICFKLANSLDYGDYFDGITNNVYAYDDIKNDFGDPEESMLKTTINFILNKNISTSASLYDTKNLNKSEILYSEKRFNGLLNY